MARVRLTRGHVINGVHLPAGRVVSDGVSPQPGDFIFPGLSGTSFTNCMVALDAGANTIQAASRFLAGPSVGFISGRDSIDG